MAEGEAAPQITAWLVPPSAAGSREPRPWQRRPRRAQRPASGERLRPAEPQPRARGPARRRPLSRRPASRLGPRGPRRRRCSRRAWAGRSGPSRLREERRARHAAPRGTWRLPPGGRAPAEGASPFIPSLGMRGRLLLLPRSLARPSPCLFLFLAPPAEYGSLRASGGF